MVEGETSKLRNNEVGEKIERWEYETRFKSYLYRISILGNEGVESINNFPSKIGLSTNWHEALERIKAESLDGKERWVPIGMKQDRVSDFIPETSIKGYFTQAKNLTKAEIKQQCGIVHLGGDIHSHPSDWFNRLGVGFIVATRLVKDFEGFSDGDMYSMVDGEGLPMSGLVEKSHNYFAFRTTETKDLQPDSPLRDKMAFSRYWSGKHGGHYFGKSHLNFWASPKFSARETNMDIARAYNIALYRGKPGEDLVREYP